ncbi:MAG: DUF547 domain-containing protein [Nitrospinae bacterium]|nr:DUF547 domain-containing protein [Nitrospinota bacterium]
MLKNKVRVFIHSALVLFLFSFHVSLAAAFDFSGWDALLKTHVGTATRDGVVLNTVAYKSLKADPGLKKVTEGLKTASLDGLKTKEEKLSFWINTYNILAVKVVVDNYPVKSIKDVGSLFKSVWKRPAGVVAGKERSLDEVEHEILRKMGEPRIHVAIVCASVSCPDLRKEAYTPERLNEQLDDQVKKFLENTGKGMKINGKKKRIYVSSIFKWFEGDFESQGGVTKFISQHVSPSRQKSLKDFGGKLKYLDYNWDLNDL